MRELAGATRIEAEAIATIPTWNNPFQG